MMLGLVSGGRYEGLVSCPGDKYGGMELPGVMGGVGFPPRGELGYPDIIPRLPGWNAHKHRGFNS